MGMVKEIVQETQNTAEYWSINNIDTNKKARVTDVKLFVYKNHAAYEAGAVAVDNVTERIEGDEWKSDLTVKEIYTILKKRDRWKDAENHL